MEYKTFVLYLFCLLNIYSCIDQASFYGNSFISVPFKEASSSTYIHFKFKTHLVDALILLVAGTTDYCIVELENGRIKVNINLGAGESELLSSNSAKLNDFKWHEVSIERREANLSIIIDKLHKVQKHLPGKFFELNIHYGLFVGDNKNKNNTDIFFGHVDKFRGCISGLKYNDIMVLEHARHRQSQSTVQGITWNCAAEFEATVDHPISFVEDDAYMVIPQKIHYKEFKIEFEVRTATRDGIIFYNPGHKLRPDFFLIELNNYSIRVVIKNGEKILKLVSKNMKVSDGEWHKVFCRLTPTIIELSVDEKITSEKNIHGHLFQLTDSSYLGGLEVSKRFRATQKGCSKSCDSSFKGCIRHLFILDMKKGLPHAHITEGLLPGCMWQYPCLQNPCNDNGICIQRGLDSFQCQCQEDLCVNVNYTERYKVFSKNSLATELELLSVEALEILEGQSEIITTKNLHMILDYQKYGIKDSGINFFIIEGPEHGSITIDIWPHEKNSFSLYDVARDKVHYVHDGSEHNHDSMVLEVEFSTADTFTLPVYLQGKFRFSLSANIIPTNDPPVLDMSDSTVLRTVQIIKNFTQEDINHGLISYLNEHSGGNADDIGIRVRCKDAINVAQLGVWMLPSNYWDPLEVKSLKKLSVEESTSALITKKVLEVLQSNVPPSAITYHIVEMPEYGYITILSDTKNGNEPVNVVCFTQNLINENKVLYIQSGTNQTKDKIIFNVTNGIVWRKNIQLNIEIIPERLYLESHNLMVNEGGVAVISTSHLFVLTEYYKSKITVYIIKENVNHGCIQVHKHCIKSKAFSQKELEGGVVQYSHDGSENLEDQLVLIGEAGQKKSFPVILKIIVLPVNDQKPKLVNNTGLVMWEGGVAVITNHMLAAVDDDRPKETLKYQVQSCWWGSVSLLSDVSTSLNYFTQELLDKGMVVFRHENGSEARFKFNISDGLHTTKDYLFHIKTKPVQLKLISKPLHIFPLQKKYITSNHLFTSISDIHRKVYYEVMVPPSLGRLMMESEKMGIFKVVSSFTQDDLNNSRVFYEHTHQFSDLYANDSFLFNVKAHLAPKLTMQILKIDISVSSGGLDAYVSVPKISVDEGRMTNIPLNLSGVVSFLENHAGLRSPIIHASAMTPLHGQVYLQKNKNLTTFTQQQLESGQVFYEHDHSDSLGDNIHFSLYLIPGYITLCNITVPVIVNPINDQPFILVTPAPSMVVVQGENHTITRHELATEDADTPPSKLKYDLISGPSNGKLILVPEGVPITYFTQADIDDNRLVYIHQGSTLKDSFHFRIWDEKFRPEFGLFNIMVVPINITILPGLPVYLLQGSDVVFLSEKQFFIDTNADKAKVQFTVKRPTKHGVLYKDNPLNPFYKDKPMTSFTYVDLIGEKVMYLQTDMTTANDSFRVFGEISSGNTSFGSEIEVVIRVQPFMHIHNFTIKAGEMTRISLNVLDATPLAKLTNSNPRYTILSLPQYGQIRRVIRSSGEKRNLLDMVVKNFTHEELQSGLIYMAIQDIEVPWDGIQDKLVFTLAATIFQPAIGELKVNIRSPLDNDISSTLPGPSDPAGHEGGLHLASPNMTRDYLLIVSMVAGVVILGIAVIVVIKCRSLDAHMNKEEQCIQPIPLPRPPDRLMSSSPPLKSSLIDGLSTPMSTALPQCKVTPLNRGELESPSSHACYPYGVDEQPDDWSSIDASDIPSCPSKNIMLRRNQYWV